MTGEYRLKPEARILKQIVMKSFSGPFLVPQEYRLIWLRLEQHRILENPFVQLKVKKTMKDAENNLLELI